MSFFTLYEPVHETGARPSCFLDVSTKSGIDQGLASPIDVVHPERLRTNQFHQKNIADIIGVMRLVGATTRLQKEYNDEKVSYDIHAQH